MRPEPHRWLLAPPCALSWLIVLRLISPTPSRAHDIPSERVDRVIQILLEPGQLRIAYEVSLAELTLVQDLRQLIGSLPGSDRAALYERYGSETGPLNARGLLVTVDGQERALEFERFDLAIEEHPRYTFHLSTPLPEQGRLTVQDTNYASSEGTSRLAVRLAPGLWQTGYAGPAEVEQVPALPVWQLSDAQEQATRQVALSFGPSERGAAGPTIGTAPARDRANPSDTPPSSRLTRLLDRATGRSWLALGLIALGFGAAHAIQPGHGKTLVAAASLGRSGSALRGVALALITTWTHFAVVLAVAAVVALVPSRNHATLHLTLTRMAGFLIGAIGLWRLGRHLAGYEEHTAEATIPSMTAERGSLLGLGLAGGLVPCWDAVVLVLVADLAGRLPLGLFLLAGFSLGMAVVLVGVGLIAGRTRSALAASQAGERWSGRLGALSGLALAGLGLYLLGT